MADLQIQYRGQIYRLPEGETVIGRQRGSDIRVVNREVSRQHAVLRVMHGVVLVRDLGSKNGTRINGGAIRGEQRLEPGDHLKIGEETLQLLDSSSEAFTTERPPNSPLPMEDTATGTNIEAIMDIAEVVFDVEHPAQRQSLISAVDELLESAGRSQPKLTEDDATRVLHLADVLTRRDPTGLETWRATVRSRVAAALSRPNHAQNS